MGVKYPDNVIFMDETGELQMKCMTVSLREYKSKQQELLSEQMQDHSDADEQFYITANLTLNIAKQAKIYIYKFRS